MRALDESLVRTPDGRELGVACWGDPSGSPIFVLHGAPGSRYLRHVGGEYERNGIRAVTYDRPGYGRSTRARERRIVDSGADVVAIADALGMESFAVVGISSGGPHALAAAATFPDRVTRCATIAGVGPPDADDLDFFAGMSEEEIYDTTHMAEVDDSMSGRFYLETMEWVDALAAGDDLPDHIRDMLVRAFREAMVQGPGGLIDDCELGAKAWGFDIGDVQCMTRVMIARDDVNVPPSHGYWQAKHLRRGSVVIVDGGHFGPREKPEEDLLAWLAASES